MTGLPCLPCNTLCASTLWDQFGLYARQGSISCLSIWPWGLGYAAAFHSMCAVGGRLVTNDAMGPLLPAQCGAARVEGGAGGQAWDLRASTMRSRHGTCVLSPFGSAKG